MITFSEPCGPIRTQNRVESPFGYCSENIMLVQKGKLCELSKPWTDNIAKQLAVNDAGTEESDLKKKMLEKLNKNRAPEATTAQSLQKSGKAGFGGFGCWSFNEDRRRRESS